MLLKRIAFVLLASGVAVAADRHVFLDTNGDGFLNQCTNPAHNTFNTPSTGNLQYCVGGSNAGKVLGDKTGYVSSCPSGTITNVTNGVSADIDADGTNEVLYGHPQACVWNMVQSDSCEIHAGTYTRAGARCLSNCGNYPALSGTVGVCQSWNCFLASVVAYGPSAGTGYGTSSVPGWLRGAVMSGSTDTWDSDGDKIPDTVAGEPTSYAPIISGNSDGDATLFETTTCDQVTCTGDAFYALQLGCGSNGTIDFCSAGMANGVFVDTDANGTFDTETGKFNPRNTDWLQVKDIEWRDYNGGNTCPGSNECGSSRTAMGEATFEIHGEGAMDGVKFDHNWVHANDYAVHIFESQWAMFADAENEDPTIESVWVNNLLEQNNEKLWNSDHSGNTAAGAQWNIHNNRIIINVTSARARDSYVALFYLKPVSVWGPANIEKVHRFWNNEVILKSVNAPNAKFVDLQRFGNSGLGQWWLYGNLFRRDPSATSQWGQFWGNACENGFPGYDVYFLQNTIDWGGTSLNMTRVCADTPAIIVEKGNAYFSSSSQPSNVSTTPSGSTTNIRTNQICSASGQASCTQNTSARTTWFNLGNYSAGNPDEWEGLTNYAAKSGGPLDEFSTGTPCDPDGNGSAGMDYDGDGTNDTSWTDIAGNVVNCPTTTTTLDLGAIQSSSDSGGPTQTCPNNIREGTEVCDGTDLAGQTCLTMGHGWTGGVLACSADCTAFVETGCQVATVQSGKAQGVKLTGGAIH